MGLVCLCMHEIPLRAYSSVGREAGAVCVKRLAVFVPSLPHPLLSTVHQCDGCLSYLGRGGSWLGCQVWPAISAVSILELVANSGSSRMSREPNLHSLRATKLFNVCWCHGLASHQGGIFHFSKIQLVVYHQCCILIG